MSEQPGLRERKKDATRFRLMQVATDLFEARGFDEVSVAEIAEAAEVSKKTVFNYFDVKEDLVLGHGKHQIGDPARVVRERAVGQTPHGALRQQWFERLAEHHPTTGLSDRPEVLRVLRLIHNTPQLSQRQMRYSLHSQDLLARELLVECGRELTAKLIAAQLFTLRQTLSVANFCGIAAGASAEERYPDAVAEAELGFGLLENGLGDTLMRTELHQRIPGYQPSGLTLGFGPFGHSEVTNGRPKVGSATARTSAGPAGTTYLLRGVPFVGRLGHHNGPLSAGASRITGQIRVIRRFAGYASASRVFDNIARYSTS